MWHLRLFSLDELFVRDNLNIRVSHLKCQRVLFWTTSLILKDRFNFKLSLMHRGDENSNKWNWSCKTEGLVKANFHCYYDVVNSVTLFIWLFHEMLGKTRSENFLSRKKLVACEGGKTDWVTNWFWREWCFRGFSLPDVGE